MNHETTNDGKWVRFHGVCSGAGEKWEVYNWVCKTDLAREEYMDDLAREAAPEWTEIPYSCSYEWEVVENLPPDIAAEMKDKHERLLSYAQRMLKRIKQ